MKKFKLNLCFLAAFCLFTNLVQAFNVNVSAVSPTGACRENLYSVSFSGVAIGTQITIAPSLNSITGSCIGSTQGLYMSFVNASGGGVTVTDSGSVLIFTVNSPNAIVITYHCYIDCHIVGNSNVNLTQTFSASPGPITVNGSGSTFQTTGVTKPDIVLQNTATFRVAYLSSSYMQFNYKNNLPNGTASIHFNFSTDSTYCNQVTTDSIFYRKNYNGTTYHYKNNSADTITLAYNDTLIVLQKITTAQCINTNSCTANAGFTWQCNYPAVVDSAFCRNCNGTTNRQFYISNNDLPDIDIIRLSPSAHDATREFSCFNDTANAVQWNYAIVNSGIGAIDSLFFDFLQWETRTHPEYLEFLSLINKKSISISTSVGSICTIDTTLLLRPDWLCKNFVDTAIHRINFNVKNLGLTDTIFFSFKTFRCSEEANAQLINKPKNYNQWGFNLVNANDICGINHPIAGFSGLFGDLISQQSIINNDDDLNLKLNYFPTTSYITVDNAGVGDFATFNMSLKGLVLPGKQHIYQLLGCDTTQQECDTLFGWLRTTIFCDTNIRIADPANDVHLIKINNGDTIFYPSHYYYTSDTIGNAICRRRNYYFYFNLADSAMRTVLDSGKLLFRFQSCCGSDMPVTPYSVTWHLLPNPNNCFTLNFTGPLYASHLKEPVISSLTQQAWLPLNDKINSISVLCPGCTSPGLIAQHYYMQRKTLGLQDTDNDGFADSANAVIDVNSAWYAQHAQDINRSFSGFGDKVEDFMRANFVDGDNNAGGYTYQQLKDQGLRFNLIQLSRLMPAAIDTMNLLPDSIYFYIDDDSVSAGGCLECEPYGYGPNDYTTVRKYSIGPNDMADFLLARSSQYDEFRFIFTSYLDTVTNVYSGNLHDNQSIITYNNGAFGDFYVGQHYRIQTIYNICGNFMPVSATADNVIKESRILNRMFLSGAVQDTVSDFLIKQPNTEAELNQNGYTVYTDSTPTYTLVDTAFINNHMFFCEATGGVHYFISNTVTNGSKLANTDGCMKKMTLRAQSLMAGGKDILDVYPYEYKPPVLMPVNYNLQIPFGYYIKDSYVRNIAGINSPQSDTVLFHLSDNTGGVLFTADSLPQINCLSENNNPVNNDSLFLGDQQNTVLIELNLAPLSCGDSTIVSNPATVAQIGFNVLPSCIPNSAYCSPASNLVINPTIGIDSLRNNPQLTVTNITTPSADLNSDTICWNGITISNPNVGSDPTAAANVFIALPNPPAFFSQWHFTIGNTIIPAISNSVIPVTPLLTVNSSITGNLCAVINNCPYDTVTQSFNFHYGWNCANYPAAPYDSNGVCFHDFRTLKFKKANVAFNTSQKYHASSYTLCDTVSVWAPFTSSQLGYLYPDSVMLQNLSPALQIVSAYMVSGNNTNPFDTAFAFLTPTANNNVWLTNIDSIRSIHFPEGGINNGQTIYIRYLFRTGCAYASLNTLPDFMLYAHDFCSNGLVDSATFSGSGGFAWDSTSICTDCFSITKTASADTVAVGDTVTFTIQVCSNNGSTQSVIVKDILPPALTVTSSNLPAFPHVVSLPAGACSTYTVKGIYNTLGTCPNDSLTNNAIAINGVSDTVSASVCVNVIAPCWSPGTLTWVNNTNSSTLNSIYIGNNIIIQDTLIVSDSILLQSCHVFMYSGACIIVTSTGSFNTENTIIEGCNTMWRGIILEQYSDATINGFSRISDANIALLAKHNSSVRVINSSSLTNNVIGIRVPARSAGNNVFLEVDGATIGMYASSFKPFYAGQLIDGQTPGVIPKAGIDLSDGAFNFNPSNRNTFYNMCTGVTGRRTNITISNASFFRMQKYSYYGLTYSGAAIASQGTSNASPGYLTVYTTGMSGYNIYVDSCNYGIYSDKTDLYAESATIQNAEWGVYAYSSGNYSSIVYGCNITGRSYGVQVTVSPNAPNVDVSYNVIKVNKGSNSKAISFDQTSATNTHPYIAYGNTIDAVTGTGIYCSNIKNAQLTENTIKLSGNTSGTGGITLTGTDSSTVQCNQIKGKYPTLTYTNKGIYASISKNNTIACNTVDSTYRGIEFAGVCGTIDFKGNSIKKHYVGLYLGSSANIDQQPVGGSPPYHGNTWLDTLQYSSGFGAVNMNSVPAANLSLNLFSTNQSNAFHNPKIPLNTSNPFGVNNTGWFAPFPNGSTFSCQSNNVCSSSSFSQGSQELRMSIAQGDDISTEFEEETKIMAQQTLYNDLNSQPSLLTGNTVLQDFVTENQSTSIGLLHDTKTTMDDIGMLDNSEQQTFHSSNAVIKLYADSIKQIDSSWQLNSSVNYMQAREVLVTSLSNAKAILASILAQQATQDVSTIAVASSINATVTPVELPDSYEQIINTIQLDYELNGMSGITNNYLQLYNIATDCPLSGGTAVFRARVLLSLVNDSIEYNDETVCAQFGYLRKAQIVKNGSNFGIKIKPNPASEKIEVLSSTCIEFVSLKNVNGIVVHKVKLDGKQNKTTIFTLNLAPGVYALETITNDKEIYINKVVIIK